MVGEAKEKEIIASNEFSDEKAAVSQQRRESFHQEKVKESKESFALATGHAMPRLFPPSEKTSSQLMDPLNYCSWIFISKWEETK